MDYITQINETLMPKPKQAPLVLDLFAGCGGLALGFEAEGFATVGFEMNADACATYRRNLHGECHQVRLAPETVIPASTVIIGGPPCQPFSVVGNQKGVADDRDGFPVFISAVRALQPDIWLFENVRGLLYRSKWYLEQVLSELRELGYVVEVRLLNAAQYGVPQNRERVVVVGHRGVFHFPKPIYKVVTAGEALIDLAHIAPPESKFLTESMDKYIATYERKSQCVRPRDLHLNTPARTLTCRNLAGATSDMHRIRLSDGRRRRLLIREAARLQSFPDWFTFEGSEASIFNQIGNAVPPLMAFQLAKSVREYLASSERLDAKSVRRYASPVQPSLFTL